MGKQRTSCVQKISAIQFSSREYCIAWFTFFLTVPYCSKSIFPPPHDMSVRGGKRRPKNKKKRQPFRFCNRVVSPRVSVPAWNPTTLVLFQKLYFIYLQLDMHQKVLHADNKWEDLPHGKGVQSSILQRWWLWLRSALGCVLANDHQQRGEVLSQGSSQELHDAH